MLLYYIKTTLRNIRRNTLFSILNTAGLGIGICVFLFTMEYYNFEKGFNQFHARLPQLYRVNIAGTNGKSPETFPALAPFMQNAIPGVRSAIRFGDNFNSGAILSYSPAHNPSGTKSFRDEGCVFVDPAFLDAFSFPLLTGSNQLVKPNTILITARLANKLFGDEPAVGKVVRLHNQFGNLPLTVTGVLKDIPIQSDIQFSCLLPMEILKNPGYTEGSDWARPDSWGNESYTTFAWLDPGADPARVAAQASEIWRQNDPDYKKERGSIQLQPLSGLHLGNSSQDDDPAYGSLETTRFILALGILVCSIAWINYISFSTAFAISQARQIGIHKVVGSSRGKIILRYILEAFVLNGMAVLLAGALTVAFQPVFNYLTGRPLSLHFIRHLPALASCGAVVLIGIALCGGYVGWQVSRF